MLMLHNETIIVNSLFKIILQAFMNMRNCFDLFMAYYCNFQRSDTHFFTPLYIYLLFGLYLININYFQWKFIHISCHNTALCVGG